MFIKNKNMRGLIFGLLACIYLPLQAQQLKPGFDPQEYHDLLSLPERGDSGTMGKHPDNFSLLYISPEVGFYNRWFLWKRSD